MPRLSSNEADNQLLYKYIQLAYEYVQQISQEPIQGKPMEVLSNLYRQRALSVLTQQLPTVDTLDKDFGQVREWFRDERAKKASDILVGHISDFKIGNDTPDLFQRNEPRTWEKYQLDLAKLESLGLDAYATYLPIHFFFSEQERDTDWGIYISEDGIIKLAAALRRAISKDFHPLAPGQDGLFVSMAYQVLLRHELEHFKIESFALNAELVLHRAIYAPYLTNVFSQVCYTDECLEEALANASVLRSVAINNLFVKEMYPPPPTKRPPSWRWNRAVQTEFFDKQPQGYSNYQLLKGWSDKDDPFAKRLVRQTSDSAEQIIFDDGSFDANRRRRAMNYLCNQILTSQIRPTKADVPFFAFLPDNYFLRAENLVPIHIVTSLDDDQSFIQMATPSRKIWERFLREIGYEPEGRGKGDHEVWVCPGRLPLTINYRGKEVDYNSYKSSLKNIGLTIQDFQTYKATKQLPLAFAKTIR